MSKFAGKNLAAALCAVALCASLPFTHVTEARAQQTEPTDSAPTQEDARRLRPGALRRRAAAHLLAQLNLSPEQRAQLREIRRTSAPEGQALAQRLQRARYALDAAIYADQTDEALIAERTREVAAAQAAVIRMRAETELRVRRVLTPAQLELFRQLRRQTMLRQRRNRR
ncbi:MAG TPA: Spy/CpxP family protein refolding chaperone [Pyrinomonadaceae bacterium]|nr:Spy/CpxP family protein refolding chaperone [Pyrinomonadaceae bacterium]